MFAASSSAANRRSFEQKIVRGAGADDGQAAVAPGQDTMGEDQHLGAEGPGLELFPGELQDAPHLRRIGQVGERPQIDRTLRLRATRAAQEAPVPGLAAPPRHGDAVASVEVMEFELGPRRAVGTCRLLPIGEVRKERTGNEFPRSATGHAVGTRARQEDRRLAATVGTGKHADGIVEGHPQIPDAAQVPDSDLRQRVVAVAVARAQRVPNVLQLPGDQRHFLNSRGQRLRVRRISKRLTSSSCPYPAPSANSSACSGVASDRASRMISGQLCTSPLYASASAARFLRSHTV